jgi:hypothetical protein
MRDPERDDRLPPPTGGLWAEALWGAGLIGVVMLLTLLASVLGRS